MEEKKEKNRNGQFYRMIIRDKCSRNNALTCYPPIASPVSFAPIVVAHLNIDIKTV